jgi:hypothetical protein
MEGEKMKKVVAVTFGLADFKKSSAQLQAAARQLKEGAPSLVAALEGEQSVDDKVALINSVIADIQSTGAEATDESTNPYRDSLWDAGIWDVATDLLMSAEDGELIEVLSGLLKAFAEKYKITAGDVSRGFVDRLTALLIGQNGVIQQNITDVVSQIVIDYAKWDGSKRAAVLVCLTDGSVLGDLTHMLFRADEDLKNSICYLLSEIVKKNVLDVNTNFVFHFNGFGLQYLNLNLIGCLGLLHQLFLLDNSLVLNLDDEQAEDLVAAYFANSSSKAEVQKMLSPLAKARRDVRDQLRERGASYKDFSVLFRTQVGDACSGWIDDRRFAVDGSAEVLAEE